MDASKTPRLTMCDHLWRHALSRIGCTRVSDGSDRDILASALPLTAKLPPLVIGVASGLIPLS